uniref:Uncharacterized protein n=1 Tax=Chromera velia CCMP2878 TaxID=1169474 RepID=A0A0G4HRH5_9ALVE|eukprot:Cvel_1277.t1-p1 / transcript=Cvel_1277.t1 / gene=Cvel_1277 / organism=Chromera_velia_CCMP2878 / gene_product=hypothetical protein / transcript_product=hypothetical protein / location=Cvel_scaffold43:14885-21445(-) / protein_length=2018 / sequence_SO=supercontig / SO=protein_coding / is_pseudo=false
MDRLKDPLPHQGPLEPEGHIRDGPVVGAMEREILSGRVAASSAWEAPGSSLASDLRDLLQRLESSRLADQRGPGQGGCAEPGDSRGASRVPSPLLRASLDSLGDAALPPQLSSLEALDFYGALKRGDTRALQRKGKGPWGRGAVTPVRSSEVQRLRDSRGSSACVSWGLAGALESAMAPFLSDFGIEGGHGADGDGEEIVDESGDFSYDAGEADGENSKRAGRERLVMDFSVREFDEWAERALGEGGWVRAPEGKFCSQMDAGPRLPEKLGRGAGLLADVRADSRPVNNDAEGGRGKTDSKFSSEAKSAEKGNLDESRPLRPALSSIPSLPVLLPPVPPPVPASLGSPQRDRKGGVPSGKRSIDASSPHPPLSPQLCRPPLPIPASLTASADTTVEVGTRAKSQKPPVSPPRSPSPSARRSPMDPGGFHTLLAATAQPQRPMSPPCRNRTPLQPAREDSNSPNRQALEQTVRQQSYPPKEPPVGPERQMSQGPLESRLRSAPPPSQSSSHRPAPSICALLQGRLDLDLGTPPRRDPPRAGAPRLITTSREGPSLRPASALPLSSSSSSAAGGLEGALRDHSHKDKRPESATPTLLSALRRPSDDEPPVSQQYRQIEKERKGAPTSLEEYSLSTLTTQERNRSGRPDQAHVSADHGDPGTEANGKSNTVAAEERTPLASISPLHDSVPVGRAPWLPAQTGTAHPLQPKLDRPFDSQTATAHLNSKPRLPPPCAPFSQDRLVPTKTPIPPLYAPSEGPRQQESQEVVQQTAVLHRPLPVPESGICTFRVPTFGEGSPTEEKETQQNRETSPLPSQPPAPLKQGGPQETTTVLPQPPPAAIPGTHSTLSRPKEGPPSPASQPSPSAFACAGLLSSLYRRLHRSLLSRAFQSLPNASQQQKVKTKPSYEKENDPTEGPKAHLTESRTKNTTPLPPSLDRKSEESTTAPLPPDSYSIPKTAPISLQGRLESKIRIQTETRHATPPPDARRATEPPRSVPEIHKGTHSQTTGIPSFTRGGPDPGSTGPSSSLLRPADCTIKDPGSSSSHRNMREAPGPSGGRPGHPRAPPSVDKPRRPSPQPSPSPLAALQEKVERGTILSAALPKASLLSSASDARVPPSLSAPPPKESKVDSHHQTRGLAGTLEDAVAVRSPRRAEQSCAVTHTPPNSGLELFPGGPGRPMYAQGGPERQMLRATEGLKPPRTFSGDGLERCLQKEAGAPQPAQAGVSSRRPLAEPVGVPLQQREAPSGSERRAAVAGPPPSHLLNPPAPPPSSAAPFLGGVPSFSHLNKQKEGEKHMVPSPFPPPVPTNTAEPPRSMHRQAGLQERTLAAPLLVTGGPSGPPPGPLRPPQGPRPSSDPDVSRRVDVEGLKKESEREGTLSQQHVLYGSSSSDHLPPQSTPKRVSSSFETPPHPVGGFHFPGASEDPFPPGESPLTALALVPLGRELHTPASPSPVGIHVVSPLCRFEREKKEKQRRESMEKQSKRAVGISAESRPVSCAAPLASQGFPPQACSRCCCVSAPSAVVALQDPNSFPDTSVMPSQGVRGTGARLGVTSRRRVSASELSRQSLRSALSASGLLGFGGDWEEEEEGENGKGEARQRPNAKRANGIARPSKETGSAVRGVGAGYVRSPIQAANPQSFTEEPAEHGGIPTDPFAPWVHDPRQRSRAAEGHSTLGDPNPLLSSMRVQNPPSGSFSLSPFIVATPQNVQSVQPRHASAVVAPSRAVGSGSWGGTVVRDSLTVSYSDLMGGMGGGPGVVGSSPVPFPSVGDGRGREREETGRERRPTIEDSRLCVNGPPPSGSAEGGVADKEQENERGGIDTPCDDFVRRGDYLAVPVSAGSAAMPVSQASSENKRELEHPQNAKSKASSPPLPIISLSPGPQQVFSDPHLPPTAEDENVHSEGALGIKRETGKSGEPEGGEGEKMKPRSGDSIQKEGIDVEGEDIPLAGALEVHWSSLRALAEGGLDRDGMGLRSRSAVSATPAPPPLQSQSHSIESEDDPVDVQEREGEQSRITPPPPP